MSFKIILIFSFFITGCGVKDTPKFEINQAVDSYVDSHKKKEELEKENKIQKKK